ncbi:MAG TPA: cyclic nucleotide-binding domain-containing protein [Aggregatilineales bacterium]|nr:cyclic nucleotide-binding domain-containing protein [Anaerolineales bacterium]HRE48166.1 cyclic nucleotide-binding domain-containing protein [Aggregatilineales bacterium]
MTNRDDLLSSLLGKRQPAPDPNAANAAETPAPSSAPASAGGITPLDLLALPAPQRKIVNWLSRKKGATLAELAASFGSDEASLEAQITELLSADYIQVLEGANGKEYHVHMRGTVRRGPVGLSSEIWTKVDLDHMTFLKQTSLFRGLNEDHLREVARLLGERRFQPGEIIQEQGKPSEHLYLIKNGLVGITRRLPARTTQRALAFLRSGEMFGTYSLLPDQASMAGVSATALTPVETVFLKRADVFALMGRYPNVGIELVRMIVGRYIHDDAHYSKVMGTHLVLVIGVGLGVGLTTLAATLARAIAEGTGEPTAYTEHPDAQRLAGVYGIPPITERVRHASGYEAIINPGFAAMPAPMRATLVYESLVNRYKNLVIGVPGWTEEIICYLTPYADQVVVVRTPDPDNVGRFEKFMAFFSKIMPMAHLHVRHILKRTKPEHQTMPAPEGIEIDLPYVETIPPIGAPAPIPESFTLLTEAVLAQVKSNALKS